jgi:hypothetical protein
VNLCEICDAMFCAATAARFLGNRGYVRGSGWVAVDGSGTNRRAWSGRFEWYQLESGSGSIG